MASMGHKFIFLLSTLFILASCKEFYEKDFLEDADSSNESENVTYTTNLSSTDASLSRLTGTAKVDVQNENVKVDVSLSELPQNIIQIHYGYSTSPCSALTNSIPAELGTTRSYNISEDLTSVAFNFDVQSAGSDTNLAGKSFIIRAFSNLENAGTTGGTVLNIACGELAVDTTDSTDTTETPTTDPQVDTPI